MAQLRIRRSAYALGAEVTGIDLREPLDDASVAAIRAAWLDNLLLCFPGQDLDSERLLEIAKRFGTLEVVFAKNALPDSRHLGLLSNRPVNGKPVAAYKNGQNWHTDKSFTTRPTTATFISCKEIPAVGGDTMFANMYLAYETLSPAMQKLVEGLSAIHDASAVHEHSKADQQGGVEAIRQAAADRAAAYPPTVQPAVRVHPETKRKAVYLGTRVRRFVGMTEEESKPLLDFLNAHAVRYEFTYRHRWHVNDLVMWDNRCLMHIALCDYDLQHDIRHMVRFAVHDAESGCLYDPAEETAAAAV